MTWSSAPSATGPNSITMTATTATAPSGVEYYFHRTGIKSPLDFDDLFGGEPVSFEIDANFGDPRAVQVSAA